jgi:hypothetical protein
MLCTNCIYVDEGELKISTNKLYTKKVGTCSLLLFSYKNKNFLAHIDALKNNSDDIINILKKNFIINKLKYTKIYIIKGSWCNNECITIDIIVKALKQLNLKYSFYKENIKWKNTIYIDKNKIEIF